MPSRLLRGLGPHWMIPTLEAVLPLVPVLVDPLHTDSRARHFHFTSLTLVALINLANVVSLVELLHALLSPGATKLVDDGRSLAEASVPIWITNVLVFGLWYCELDGGGPAQRARTGHREPDFLFAQMTVEFTPPSWRPRFFDDLYTSFTNATAFSTTDTMPLTTWAKFLMMVQSLASLLTVALVISLAVHILS